jgi:hypothetical protein
MQIEKKSQLVIGNAYFIYKVHLSQTLTNLKTSKPAEYVYEGIEKSRFPTHKWSVNYIHFRKKIKKGYAKRTKQLWNTDNDKRLHFGSGSKCFSSYAEACEAYDYELCVIKQKLFTTSQTMRQLYDSVDEYKIGLRKSKLDRINV